ncbi:hypothetical protein CO046_00815 [Candidatus Peregrinibacteria bacterium CG_4_9_14_0_2_um_filter_53_11]|uniref:DUF4015 domain-containing protein n=1 Tax=candidate division WWE3 bacterium CG_4_9_14_3_um_filter_39_7 TaxID=1975080 RepID=A0A2M7X2H2_UNCKA|nr:MAG: hypothetical protein CO179_02610 [candidate division WWE3 bacterium CG_4_9_14_3_um_filter_39_7]PJC37372.1 MAG: hypothetical protein CO046_00815 [Candidatus Peregrinibacteria bacterium CG_4_9_14_0_2_um_filter_53_11]
MSLFTVIAALSLSMAFNVGQPVLTLPDISRGPLPTYGIYITSHTAVTEKGSRLAEQLVKKGGNILVMDIQGSGGRLAYNSQLPLSVELDNRSNQIPDLKAKINEFHDDGAYVVARFVLFKSPFLAAHKPEWTIKAKGTNRPYSNREGAIWMDPANPELLAYYKQVVKELALSGVDEVQFDYVRFPEAGAGGNIGYSFTGSETTARDDAIVNAVREIGHEVREFGVKIGVDIFGIVVWDNISWKLIGQNISKLDDYVDVIYPMPYPSHFGPGWGGHTNPADEPYFFVGETAKKFAEQTEGSGVIIRTWLQGFNLRVTNYGPNYIREQIRALHDLGMDQFVIWNAANNYEVSWPALP